jgi:hypothetical protein
VKRQDSSDIIDSGGAPGQILRRPSVSASIGAAVGLLAGVLIGRATVHRPDAAEVASLSPQKAARTSGTTTPEPSTDDDAPLEPTLAYRVHLGRRLPKSAKGFESIKVGERPVAALAGKESSLRFDLDPSNDEYMLSLITFVDGAKSVTVHPHLDDRALTDITFEPGWGIYASAVPKDGLTGSSHELTLGLDTVPEKAVIAIDSVTVAPLEAEVSFGLGAEAVGTLVDGFSKPSEASVWSEGPRSVLGIVLAPTAAKQYRLDIRANALSRIAPLEVTARVNGTSVGTASFQKRGTDATWLVPAKALHPGVNRVELNYPKTAIPAEYNPDSKDKRSLAVKFYRIALELAP